MSTNVTKPATPAIVPEVGMGVTFSAAATATRTRSSKCAHPASSRSGKTTRAIGGSPETPSRKPPVSTRTDAGTTRTACSIGSGSGSRTLTRTSKAPGQHTFCPGDRVRAAIYIGDKLTPQPLEVVSELTLDGGRYFPDPVYLVRGLVTGAEQYVAASKLRPIPVCGCAGCLAERGETD